MFIRECKILLARVIIIALYTALPYPAFSQSIAIKAASYVDTKNGILVQPAIIVIDQGRIAAINPKALPEDTTVVNLGDATLLPRLIDVHTHLITSTNDTAELVKQARKHGLKVATHAHGSEGIMASVKAGAASIEHGSMLTDEIIGEMKSRGTFLVPTTPIMNRASLADAHLPPKGIVVVKAGIQSHRRAIDAGVKIAYGTDAGLYPHGDNADGFRDLVEYGMSPAQAIKTATVNAAELLGVDDRGAIAVGMMADIIAVEGNPLEDVSLLQDVSFVMKNGRIYKGGDASPP